MPCIGRRKAAHDAATLPLALGGCLSKTCALCGFPLQFDANRNTYTYEGGLARLNRTCPFCFWRTLMRDSVDEMAVTVRLKPEVAVEVRRAASEEGLAITAVVRRAVLRDVARRRSAA